MSDDALPEPDRVDGAPHPRFASRILGHNRQINDVLSDLGDQMHHAWLLTGPKGIGKATFAWAMAGSILALPNAGGFLDPEPASALGLSPDHPVRARLEALSEPRLALVRRGWDDRAKRLKTLITVDDVRKLHGFLGLSAPDGGHRVVLIDAADDMNVTAANAVLKLLEEPPANTVFLLVSHQPGGLLPTIKSRCRMLRFDPLSPADLSTVLAQCGLQYSQNANDALAALSRGSAGAAISLLEQDGLNLYAEIVGLLSSCPNLDRPSALALANAAAGRGAEARRDLTLDLLETALSRLAKTGAGAPPHPFTSEAESALCQKLAQSPSAGRLWADAAETLPSGARSALAVNLDPSGVILDMILKVNETAGRMAQP